MTWTKPAERIKLTNTKVKKLPSPIDKKQAFYWDSETRGLAVRVTTAGSKSWIVQSRINGKTVRFTLGPFELLAYEEASIRAKRKLLEMHDGLHPQVEKMKEKAQSETLREIMEDYLAHKRTKHGPLRPSSKRDIQTCVNRFFADWADKPVTVITRDECIKKFRNFSKTSPAQTNLAFRNLRALLNWAREKSATSDGVYTILPINPVTQMFKRGGLVQWNPETPRATRILKDKIRDVWKVLDEHSNPDLHIATTCTSADLTAFMLLTGTRIGEACTLTWANVSLDDDPPTFHLAHTKNHCPVTLPVSTALHALLLRRSEARVKNNDYVFPALRGSRGYMRDPRAMFEKVSKAAGTHIHPHSLRLLLMV